MSVSLTNTSAEPLLKTNSGFCSHCLLTLGSHPTKRAVDGEEYFFCCYGCCLAFQVKHGNREEPEAAWLLIRLGAGGFLAMKYIRASQSNISLIFKDFHADFLKRAEGDVHFKCNEGLAISSLVEKTIVSGRRENMVVHIDATVPSISQDIVAKFELTLSLKEKK